MSRDTTTPIPFLNDKDALRAQDRLAGVSEPLDAAQDRVGQEVEQDSPMARANGKGAACEELPTADFMEPVEFEWTEAGFEARQALKRYCEETNADY